MEQGITSQTWTFEQITASKVVIGVATQKTLSFGVRCRKKL